MIAKCIPLGLSRRKQLRRHDGALGFGRSLGSKQGWRPGIRRSLQAPTKYAGKMEGSGMIAKYIPLGLSRRKQICRHDGGLGFGRSLGMLGMYLLVGLSRRKQIGRQDGGLGFGRSLGMLAMYILLG